mgnify:CR=1 FL=1
MHVHVIVAELHAVLCEALPHVLVQVEVHIPVVAALAPDAVLDGFRIV